MSCGKAVLAVFCGVLLSGILPGQTHRIDSLAAKLTTVQGQTRADVLNRLTYELITNDNARALAYNQEAMALSRKIGYKSGEARAYTYRGVKEYLSGELPEGHRDLNMGLRLAIRAGDEALRGYALLQLGNCSLEEVEMDSAMIFFQQSREVFKDSTDPATLSKVYRNIGALYGQAYQPDSQMYYLDRAIRIRRLLPDKSLLVEALVTRIRAKIAMNEYADAQALLLEADAIVTDHLGDEENRNDLRHLRALVLFQKGKFGEADVLFDSARNFFFRKSLLRKYVILLIDLGNLFTERGEYELALGNLYDAIKLSELRHFDAEAAIIRIQIGRIYHELGNQPLALRMTQEAMKFYPRKLLLADRAKALMLKGAVLTDMARYSEARAALDSVVNIYSTVGSTRGQSEVLLKLAALESRQLRYTQALQDYRESARLADATAYDHGLASSYWGLGDIYLKLKQYPQAQEALDHSLKYARKAGANDITVLNYTTRRDLMSAQHRFSEALTYSVTASHLRDSIHKLDVERRFINLEKIREIERQERDIQILQADKQLAQNMLSLQEAMIKQQSILIIAGSVVVILLIGLVFVYYRFYRRIKTLNAQVVAQSEKLTAANRELQKLYQEVSDQKEEIQMQADKLTESNRAMGDVNKQLEELVSEKTAELKRTNEELIKYNHELLQFSYTVSHNLRGPVARLLGLADLAGREKQVVDARLMISLIGKTAQDLDLIIKDLSNILELRNNPHRLLETVQLEKEWEHSKRLLKESLPGNEEIITNFAALPEMRIVRPMLQSIFYNLLSNAIKYRSPERKLRVIVTSRLENDNAILEITDNGLGFNISLHNENLFKLYRRFHTHVEGRGLGLYLIKSQVDVLQGAIEVASEPDKGSTFRVILPMRKEGELYS
jgi:signal transduction histidine kinase